MQPVQKSERGPNPERAAAIVHLVGAALESGALKPKTRVAADVYLEFASEPHSR